MDPAFIQNQMQLMQAMTTTLNNLQQQQAALQAQLNQASQPGQQAQSKYREFMSHHPPTFSHSVEPLDADDWLKTIVKKVNLAQCNDQEKVLYASGRLEGVAADWWDAFVAVHATPAAITWDEFRRLSAHTTSQTA